MTSVGSITFCDGDTGDAAFVGIRVVENRLGLALSLRRDGDVEVFLTAHDARRLIDLLLEASSLLSGGTART